MTARDKAIVLLLFALTIFFVAGIKVHVDRIEDHCSHLVAVATPDGGATTACAP